MERNQAIDYIRENAARHMRKDKSRKGYICPVCGSGAGKNGTGITTKDGVHFTCWGGCFTNADIIDIIGIQYGLSDFNDKLNRAAEEYGIDLEPASGEYRNHDKTEQDTQERIHNTVNTTEEAEPDYMDFYLQANKNLDKTNYHRGLSLDTLNHFKVGYVESWTHPKAPNAPASPRLIIPTSRHSYLARDTRPELTEKQAKYSKSKVGKVRIFNQKALQTATQPVFIVEGEIDAMSVYDAGGEAVGLGSVSNRLALLKLMEAQRPVQPLILCLDNDRAGAGATEELETGLERLKIPFYKANISMEYKDANEALNADREAFIAAVNNAKNLEAIDLEAEREVLEQESASYALQDFLDNIRDSKKNPCISTGFSKLDEALDGGLYPGLYVVGAVSSLGKTTLCLQLGDQIAKNGTDVLIFSLEMGRDELIAKSISRLTFLASILKYGNTCYAKTTRGILAGKRYETYTREEKDIIKASVNVYGEYARNVYITEAMGDVGLEQIREKIDRHIRITGKPLIVIIDYLQILAPADPRLSDKQNTDRAVTGLKRIARDYHIPIIGISSFNRDNYTAPVNMTSYKESGSIEYSSDVLIGLQFAGMEYQNGEKDKDRDSRVRELVTDQNNKAKNGEAQDIQLKVLKYRNGSKGNVDMKFYPMFNYFSEQEGDSWKNDEGTPVRSKYKV